MAGVMGREEWRTRTGARKAVQCESVVCGRVPIQLMEAGMNVFKGCDAPTQADSGRADTFQGEEGQLGKQRQLRCGLASMMYGTPWMIAI
jgi:hypothetical protein